MVQCSSSSEEDNIISTSVKALQLTPQLVTKGREACAQAGMMQLSEGKEGRRSFSGANGSIPECYLLQNMQVTALLTKDFMDKVIKGDLEQIKKEQ